MNHEEHQRFKYDAFLSYSSQDRSDVLRLAERLRDNGLNVWFDEWSIGPGETILRAIEQGLNKSRFLVQVLSPTGLGSDWATLERDIILTGDPTNRKGRFVPILIKNCEIPPIIGRFKYVDYRRADDAAFQIILGACSAKQFPSHEEDEDRPSGLSDSAEVDRDLFLDSGDTPTTRTSEPAWDLKLCLIDYKSQAEDLNDLLAEADPVRANEPLIVFAFSEERVHESYWTLVDRFAKQIIPCKYRSQPLAPTIPLSWPEPGDKVDRRLQVLTRQVEEEFGISQLELEAAPGAVCQAINEQKCIRIFPMVLRNPDLGGSDAWLIDKWLDFWAQVSRHKLRCLTILFIYCSYSEKSLLGRVFGHLQRRKAIDQFLQSKRAATAVPGSDRQRNIVVLQELKPLSLTDIDEWVDKVFSGLPAPRRITLKKKLIGQFAPNKAITMGEFIDKTDKLGQEQDMVRNSF